MERESSLRLLKIKHSKEHRLRQAVVLCYQIAIQVHQSLQLDLIQILSHLLNVEAEVSFLLAIGMRSLTQRRVVHVDVTKDHILHLVKEEVRVRLILHIKENYTILDREVQCLVLLIVDPELNGQVSVHRHRCVVFLDPIIMYAFHLEQDVNLLVSAKLGNEAGAVGLLHARDVGNFVLSLDDWRRGRHGLGLDENFVEAGGSEVEFGVLVHVLR